jgi:flavin reductase (DIM6/NTAB) family NADH-FMN oxidoreductase RutF
MKKVDIDEAIKFRHPEIVVNVVTKSKENVVDITPIGWAMLGSSNPRTWAIGIAKKHYSHKAILDTKEFTVCIPHFKQKEDVIFCGKNSAWTIDKLKNVDLKFLPAEKVSTPLIKDSLACYECKLIDQMPTSDHTIFLGEIMASYVSGENEGMINLGGSNLVCLKRGRWPYEI